MPLFYKASIVPSLLVIYLALSLPAGAQVRLIKTVAGKYGVSSYTGDGGQATAATFNIPFSLATDAAGNVYVGDDLNGAIRKIDVTTGIITTFAGTGTPGYTGDNVLATTAEINIGQGGITFDKNGNLYFADQFNNRVRRIDAATGIITTVAGGGSLTGDNVSALSALVQSPRHVVFDTDGNMYISSSASNVRKVDLATGLIHTIAGTGTQGYNGDNIPAVGASLNFPEGLAIDKNNNIYIADVANYRIRKIDAVTGTITTVVGNGTAAYSGDGGLATNASIDHVWGLIVDDAGNFYFADANNFRIRTVNANTGLISTIAGVGTNGYAGDGRLALMANLSEPFGVAMDATGNIFVVDQGNSVIREITNGYLAPVISTLSPASGPIGSSVTITGTNFSSITADNSVYFGEVQATVTAATSTTLTVTVPLASAYLPVTVTTHELTAYAPTLFDVTFDSYGLGLGSVTAGSFVPSGTFATDNSPYIVFAGDLDGDGKPDLAVTNRVGNSISVLRNNGSSGTVSFSPKQTITISNPGFITMGDLDGDGKPDLVYNSEVFNNIQLYRNTSTNGSISFGSPTGMATGQKPSAIVIGDIDGDGRPDIAAVNSNDNTLSVWLNISSGPGVISFNPSVNFPTGSLPHNLVIGDLDGDGKPEIAVLNELDNSLIVFANSSSPGNLVLTRTPYSYVTGTTPFGMAIADVDGDGKLDIVESNAGDNTVTVWRNTNAITGAITLAGLNTIPTSGQPGFISLGDLDEDGKPDLVVGSAGTSSLFVFKNKSTTGTISFSAETDYDTNVAGTGIQGVALGDMDGDGKLDIIATDYNASSVSVLRNTIGESAVVASGADPVSGAIVYRTTIDPSINTYNGSPYLQRHYDIDPAVNAATATATITLYYTQADFDAFNSYSGHGADLPIGPSDVAAIANIRIFQFHGYSPSGAPGTYPGSSLQIDPADNNIVWNAGASRWEISFDVTGFSGFILSSAGNNPLPLMLLSFTGTGQGNNALLSWTTTDEQNTSYFDVQRSTDGSSYKSVGTVKAKDLAGRGNDYQYTDTLGLAPTYFYRLRMVDLDGRSTYSQVVVIGSAPVSRSLSLSPNPARQFVVVQSPVSDKDAQIRLLDMSGKLLRTIIPGRNNQQTYLDLTGLPAGIYRISWTDGTQKMTEALLVK